MTRLILCAIGAAATAALVASPSLDRLADVSFAWHMVQHIVVLFVLPFFVLAGAPFAVFARLAPRAVVRATIQVTRPLELFGHPAVAFALFVGTLWVTHFSPFYNYALGHAWAHAAEHALYLCAGLAFWTPVLAPPPIRPVAFPIRLLYLLVALPQGALLSFALGGSRRILYAHYAAYPNALADQSNAAAIMWIAGGAIVFAAFLGTFGAWALRESAAPSPHRGAIS